MKNKKILFLVLLLEIVLPSAISAANGGSDQLTQLVWNIANMLLTAGGAIVVIGWVIAGILWLTSGGSPEKTGTAKKATWAALIGTILLALASATIGIYQVIVNALTQGL